MINIISLDVTQILTLSIFLFIVSIVLLSIKKIKINYNDLKKYSLYLILLLLITSFLPRKFYSGMGIMNQYGFPHYVYNVWQSFDRQSFSQSFHLEYFLINVFFYLSFVLLILAILKKGDRKREH